MSEEYTKVEVVKPVANYSPASDALSLLYVLGFRVLFVWWAFASFFPELGLTYWQLILPVVAVRGLFGSPLAIMSTLPRKIRK